jgi:glycosyltransferase involved in cell wall biosynthesis
MIRVLFIVRDLVYHGGVPKCILNFARSCPRDRVQVHVATMMPPHPLMAQAFSAMGITPVCLGDRGYLGPTAALRRMVRQHDIDVVVPTAFKAYLCGKMAIVGLDRGVVFWIHAIPGVITGPIRKAIFRTIARRDPLVFVSKAVRDVHVFPAHRATQAVVYNGVEDPLAHPEHAPYARSMRNELGIPADALLLCYTAELTGWKDHATLLAAFQQVQRRLPRAHLLLVCTGALDREVRQQARVRGVADHVHFAGARTDARRLLGLIDIYVHSSRGEGLGLAVVEAMLLGKPVIVTHSSAFLEYINHGVSGMFFRPGDANDLAEQILMLVTNPELAGRLGRQARPSALAKFDPHVYVERLCQLIEGSLPDGRRTAAEPAAEVLAKVAPG